MWKDLVSSRELAWRLFIRDIRALYRQSVFGYLWAFVPPVLAAVPWMFLNSQKIVNIGQTPIPYPAFVMTGMMLWQSFLDALNGPLRQTSGARAMLSKINFPREALLLAGLAESLWNLAIRMVILAPVLWMFGLWTFSAGNVRDFQTLASQLRVHATPLSVHLWKQLSPEARTVLESRSVPAGRLEMLLVRDINKILRAGNLYDATRFEGIALSETTRTQLRTPPGGGESRARLNRRLLEEAYPEALRPYAPAINLLWAPAGIAGLMLLGFSIGLLITPLGLLYTDVGRGIGLIAAFGLLLTPIVYPPRTTGLAGWLATWNPVSPVLVTARNWLTGEPSAFMTGFWWVTGVSVVLLLVAWFLYRLTMPILVERMGG